MSEAQLWEPLVKSIKGARTPEVVEKEPEEIVTPQSLRYDLGAEIRYNTFRVWPHNCGFSAGDVIRVGDETMRVDWPVGSNALRVTRGFLCEPEWHIAGSAITKIARARKEED